MRVPRPKRKGQAVQLPSGVPCGDYEARRPFSYEGEIKMADDPIDNLRLFDEGNNTYLATTGRTKKQIHLEDLTDHLLPAF